MLRLLLLEQWMQLHAAATAIVEDEGALLRHRVLVATPPDPMLAVELDFASRGARWGWASRMYRAEKSFDPALVEIELVPMPFRSVR